MEVANAWLFTKNPLHWLLLFYHIKIEFAKIDSGILQISMFGHLAFTNAPICESLCSMNLGLYEEIVLVVYADNLHLL